MCTYFCDYMNYHFNWLFLWFCSLWKKTNPNQNNCWVLLESVDFLHSSWHGILIWFVLKTVLIILRFFLMLSRAYTEPRHFLPLIPLHHWVGWESTRKWEGTQLGQLTPTYQRDNSILYGLMLSILTWRRKKESGGCLGWWHFVPSSNGYIRWSSTFLEMAEHLPDNGK